MTRFLFQKYFLNLTFFIGNGIIDYEKRIYVRNLDLFFYIQLNRIDLFLLYMVVVCSVVFVFHFDIPSTCYILFCVLCLCINIYVNGGESFVSASVLSSVVRHGQPGQNRWQTEPYRPAPLPSSVVVFLRLSLI